ncbi:helix-turn-helix transcriptional regulator [Weissella confusa]|uniref:helix-turn-helix domain-containing protein n=1 Tax=Limosilactobacillus reuteri TaxID=1598 RepID=UPI001300574A|nr:helix-turn-helix transcriptional regulator [Limosilactobacillus reuteri]MCW3764657.1 helix-turn-helix transcriptional regulator [Weissella confusa]MDZ5438654.1 helix-turn-helix transcriptional regulator [Limosilactobacillus reuteri]
MIRNRLKELMDERGLKASRIANDIDNLSRNTINATVSNKGKMIQLETVNALCQYLGVTPNDFFEYLPFDVNVSIDADTEPIVSTSYVNNEIVSAEETYIKPFYLNLYLTKVGNNHLSGESKKTFELSVISSEKIKFSTAPEFGNNNFVMYTPNLKVVLGNPPTKDNMGSQKESFLNFWNKELTPGFRKVIQENIQDAVLKYISDFCSNNQWIEFNDIISINFRFDDFDSNYSELENGIVVIEKDTDELPF